MEKYKELEKLLELTPEQKKAFTALKRALNRCEKEKILLYINNDEFGALNSAKVDAYLDSTLMAAGGFTENIIPDEGQNDKNTFFFPIDTFNDVIDMCFHIKE